MGEGVSARFPFTPILTFPHQGGRDFKILTIFPIEGERTFESPSQAANQSFCAASSGQRKSNPALSAICLSRSSRSPMWT